jgi:Autotransporter beta-domain
VTLWLRANLWRDFVGNALYDLRHLSGADGLTLKGSLGGTWGEIDAGVETRINQQVSLFGSALYDRSLGSGSGWSAGGRLGVKVEY